MPEKESKTRSGHANVLGVCLQQEQTNVEVRFFPSYSFDLNIISVFYDAVDPPSDV